MQCSLAKNGERHASCTTWSEEISKSQSFLANHMVIVIISIFISFSSVPVLKRNEHGHDVSTIEKLGKSTGIVQDNNQGDSTSDLRLPNLHNSFHV